MLVKCSECGNEISDKATKCPNCGNPIKEEEKHFSVIEFILGIILLYVGIKLTINGLF